jgi:signal transduction histidine kinase
VKSKTSPADAVRLVRFAAVLWLVYVLVLVLLNRLFQQPQPPQRPPQPNDYTYYILLGCVALFCLCLAYWPWVQQRLKQAFVPLIILVITVAPIVISNLTEHQSALGPRFYSPESNVLAIFPFLFVGLLLVAWRYRWQYILYIILGITALSLAMTWISAPDMQPFQGVLVLTLIQTVIFLVIGFSISFLMGQLRAQRQSLEEANMRLTHYASTLEQLTTSRERNRLALELHDTLAHTLSGLSVQMETAKAYWDVDPPMARTILDKSLEAARSGLEETRRALKALRAGPLDDLGLALAITSLAKDVALRASLTLELSVTDKLPSLSPDIEQGIYRIAQEALANVVKHASAKKLAVELTVRDGKVILTVCDDGVGFDAGKENGTGHFGLTGMRERAHLAGGELDVTSGPGRGTTVRLTI